MPDMPHTHFRITELSVGWLDWHVRGPDIDEKIYASWVGGLTLTPMLRLATTMLTYRKEGYYWPLDSDKWEDFEVDFPGEPEYYRATFHEPEGDVASFMLEKSNDGMPAFPAPYLEIGSGTINIEEFADDLIADAAQLLREHGFVGFNEEWQFAEYPISELLRLVNVRKGGELYRVGLEQELKFLQDIV